VLATLLDCRVPVTPCYLVCLTTSLEHVSEHAKISTAHKQFWKHRNHTTSQRLSSTSTRVSCCHSAHSSDSMSNMRSSLDKFGPQQTNICFGTPLSHSSPYRAFTFGRPRGHLQEVSGTEGSKSNPQHRNRRTWTQGWSRSVRAYVDRLSRCSNITP